MSQGTAEWGPAPLGTSGIDQEKLKKLKFALLHIQSHLRVIPLHLPLLLASDG